jgi:hypothetical protein
VAIGPDFDAPLLDFDPPRLDALTDDRLGSMVGRGETTGDIVAPAVEAGEWQALGDKVANRRTGR